MSDTSGKGPDKPNTAGAKSGEPDPNAARPRPPVIDLEAKELGKTGASPATATPTPAASAPASKAPPTASSPKPEPKPEPMPKSPPPPPPPPPLGKPAKAEAAGRPQGLLPVAAAGAGGAILAVLAMAGLSAAGLLPSPDSQRVAALEGDIVRLQDALSSQGAPAPDPRVAELDARLTQFGEKLDAAAVASETAPAASDAAVTDLAGRLQQLEENLAGQLPRLDALAEADRALEQRIEALGQSRQDETAQQQAAASTNERSALALSAAAALDAALLRGQPYVQELEAVRAFLPNADVTVLATHAQSGLPPATLIASRWRQALDAAPPPPPPADAGVVDRLMANARSLVRVTPTGEPEGDSPDARRARFLSALDRADLAKAMAEWNGLSPSIKEATKEPAASAQARLDAETASASLRASALDEARKAVSAQ